MRKPKPHLLMAQRRTLKDGVYDAVRESLMSGEYEPGQRLTVRGVADALDVSTMPVREAFRRLTSEGALEPLSTGATRVPLLGRDQLAELTEIRLAVEGLAAKRAAAVIDDRELAALTAANEELTAAIRARDIVSEARANERFHFCIYRAARSPELLRIIEALWLRIGPSLLAVLRQRERIAAIRERRYVNLHKLLIDALAYHRPRDAEMALRGDIESGAHVLLTYLKMPEDRTPDQTSASSSQRHSKSIRVATPK